MSQFKLKSKIRVYYYDRIRYLGVGENTHIIWELIIEVFKSQYFSNLNIKLNF